MEIVIGARWAAALLAALLASTATHAGPVDDMLRMMEGTYRSDPASTDPDAELPDLQDRRARVSAPAFGEYVVYWQLNEGPERKIYRQRLLVFEARDDGTIVQTTWSFREPEKFVDAFELAELFASLTPEDVEATLPDGCDQVWRKSDDGWYGSVSPDSCRVWSERRQMWRRIGAEAKVEPDAYWQAERGFDDEGTQVFGTKPGEMYRLARITD